MSQYDVSCWLGQRSDVSLNEKSTTAVDDGLFTCRPVTNMRRLLEEFKELYEERLRRIDFDTKESTQEEMLRMKQDVLQSYVNDLGEQNEVLMQTVEDLKTEANNRLASLEVKLRSSHDTSAGLAQQRKVLEERVCALLSENDDLRGDVDSLKRLGWLGGHTQVTSARPVDSVATRMIGSARTQTHTAGAGETTSLASRRLELSWKNSLLIRSLEDSCQRDTQLRDTEGDLHTVMMQLQERDRQLQERDRQLQDSTKKMRVLEEELRGAEEDCVRARAEVHSHSLLLEAMTEELERATHTQEHAALEVREGEDRLQHVLQDVAALKTTQRSLNRTLSMKEHNTLQLNLDNTHLQQRLGLLQNKLQASEDTVGVMRLEVEQVRFRLAEETSLREQLQAQILQNTQDLERVQEQLASVRAAAARKIHRRESKMASLLKELSEKKKQHRDWQDQVNSRDQLIVQLRADLKTAEQMHQGSSEELTLLKAEVNHLNLKVKGHQEEACHLWEKVREGEVLRKQEEQERVEQLKQLCASRKQVKSQAETMDQMTSDLEAVKQAHRTDTECWTQRNFLLHSQLEQASSELSQSQTGVREQGLEVKRLRERLSQAEAGMQQALEKLGAVQEDLKETSSRGREQEEQAAIFRQKYSAALEKVQRRQDQIDGLEEELRHCQQQLGEAKKEVGRIKAELAELEGRFQEKLGQWESSEQALEQLTDELRSNQRALRDSQERVGQCEGVMAALQEQLDSVRQQAGQCEGSLRSYQKQHSYSDKEYFRLQKHKQLLQECCTEQAERLAESEQSLIQTRAECLQQAEDIERQIQERVRLEQSLQSLHLDLAASQHTHTAKHKHLEQEVTRLQQEVMRLGLELGEARRACSEKELTVQEHAASLQQCEEDLKETRSCLERRSRELEEAREEAQREERSRELENLRLRGHLRQHREETEELRSLHTHSVKELAACEEEVRRLEGCVSEGRQVEEKRRLEQLTQALQQQAEETVNAHTAQQHALQQVKHYQGVVQEQSSQLEVMEGNLEEMRQRLTLTEQSDSNMRLKLTSSERALSHTQEKLDSLQLQLEGALSDNTQLQQESQIIMSQVNLWVKEQRVTSESLAAQIRAQNTVLILITEEKEHLEKANDSLKQDLRMLRKERGREACLVKVQDEEKASKQQQDKERDSCVVQNLSRIQEMQARLQTNLEDIGVLNQQLAVLGGVNEALHRQLKEERSRRRQAELLNQPSTHHHLPLPNDPPSLLPHSLCPSPGPGEHYVELTWAELSTSGPQASGEAQAVGEAFWRRRVGELSAQLQHGSVYWLETLTAPTGSTSSLT